jgi:hypothetical protein
MAITTAVTSLHLVSGSELSLLKEEHAMQLILFMIKN